ncbi:MAG: redox-regulated ATPase YchF, partial [Candidatus Dormiibacterota bacterium]
MSLSIGIVGLPNVGKSTLFNAMTQAGALVANYPFATIDPNTGIVQVPDGRLTKLAELFKPPSVVPATVTFVDIAGLVKGAAEGEGLGNKFLSHIRECDAIAMVVRAFEDPNVTHVGGAIDPASDIATVDYELILADLETVERRMERTEKAARQGQKGAAEELAVLQRAATALNDAVPARRLGLKDEEKTLIRDLSLLSLKPVIYVANVSEIDAGKTSGPFLDAVAEVARAEGARWLPISARIESELRELDTAEAAEFLGSLGLEESGLDRLAREAYSLLDLITFLTAGEDEVRAWTIRRGTRAPQA